jgi:hypothetical protein
MRPTVLVLWALVGFVGGWLYHWFVARGTGTAALVSWAQPAALLLVALVLFVTAWSTRRTIRLRPGGLSPAHAVNRLVLARACAYVGALAGGGYLGYALSWLGIDSDLADQRAIRSACAAAAGLLMVVAGVLLERACRVPPEDPAP